MRTDEHHECPVCCRELPAEGKCACGFDQENWVDEMLRWEPMTPVEEAA